MKTDVRYIISIVLAIVASALGWLGYPKYGLGVLLVSIIFFFWWGLRK